MPVQVFLLRGREVSESNISFFAKSQKNKHIKKQAQPTQTHIFFGKVN
jgi:hypothetical protein